MSRNTMIVVLACLVTVVVVAFVITSRAPAPILPPAPAAAPAALAPTAPAPTATAPAPTAALPPAADASGLAKDSADPGLVSFISSFRSSSVSSCNATLQTSLQTSNPTVLAKLDGVCACATERVVATVTVDEARSTIASALTHDTDTNPAFNAIKARFIDAGKVCMADAMKN